ncbi:YqaE/Pmp3 family membrane protein [Neolewinella agarilytica]|uniref:Uncharacterized membrane protein YqaE, homolog of Blt101, UPF0057 family n=1 Tax=Neolewinella agarilytica TaxID=478744 RepID=A0A1H9PC85_9BACT|nr:YqaE/Pmp3 family membrane protein [Neolewinella agarilytica]SER45874.1 Uncharacterized membrane protein YqaE, homolog of Blt101, UPF0057 family [Neolewinella agarilytica]
MKIFTPLFCLLLSLFISVPAQAAIVVPVASETATAAENEAAAAVAAYKESLKDMSAKERRQLKREQRKGLKSAIADWKASGDTDTNTLLLVILAVLLPPVAVLVHQGELNTKFWIALILTLLLYLPGLIYALLVIFGNAKKK